METRPEFLRLRNFLSTRIIGQQAFVERLLIALLANGHLLVEGPPGLAKTRAIRVLSSGIEGDFHRVQFTPDLLPADLTGTEIFRQQCATFEFRPGPLFHNLLLADEINRAPAKVQSALLEAMAERQITVGQTTYPLPDIFLVMATQNPIEQDGTYPLPEAQLDRFLLHFKIGYPSHDEEIEVLRLTREEDQGHLSWDDKNFFRITQETIGAARREVLEIFMTEKLQRYMVQLVHATRDPGPYVSELASMIEYGASPRGTIALDRCARARAWLYGRDYVTPEDIQDLACDVLRHRLVLSYEAEVEGISPDGIIETLIQNIPAP